jgi:hypothetical protein
VKNTWDASGAVYFRFEIAKFSRKRIKNSLRRRCYLLKIAFCGKCDYP